MKAKILFIAVLLAGCDSMTFNSNLGNYARGKIAAAGVREYTLAQIGQYDAVPLGYVEASYCQDKPGERKPSRAGLVEKLKLQTHSRGGNGVVVEACSADAVPSCIAYMQCRALAYAVPERKG
ncbi:hypothetical protein [Microbulbifer sp. SAOS-129_SWC]|uniref:hypothetical protein n=1 Tax=Microbulbifer sp. SAOS-129_SWC TaxID=3145235 RepID=UPI003216AF4B